MLSEWFSVLAGYKNLDEFEQFQLAWVFAWLKEPQRKVYLGMLKGCSPEGKFADFAAQVRPMLTAGEQEALLG